MRRASQVVGRLTRNGLSADATTAYNAVALCALRCRVVREHARSYRWRRASDVAYQRKVRREGFRGQGPLLRELHNTALALALDFEGFQRDFRTRRTPRSGGLVEAEFQGLSDMDVARAAMGQGWPFVGGRLVRAPETALRRGNFSPKRKTGCPGQDLCLLWAGRPSVVCQSRSPEGAKPNASAHTDAAQKRPKAMHANSANSAPKQWAGTMAGPCSPHGHITSSPPGPWAA